MLLRRSVLWFAAFALFVTGSARAEAPTPQWIATAKDVASPGFFRAKLTLPADAQVDYADLFVAADSQAAVFVNGQRLGDARGYERMAHFPAKNALRPGENVVAVQVAPGKQRHALLLTLHAVDRQERDHWLVTSDAWKCSGKEAAAWQSSDFDARDWQGAVNLGPVGTAPFGTPTTEPEHYHQWKQALNAGTAVDPSAISVPDGYAIELLRSAGKDEGSWISLAFDERGRLVVGREDKGLLRMTLPEMPERALAGEGAAKAIQVETINDTLLECRGLLFVGKDLYANANNSKGLYRLRDTDGDDTLDEVKLLRAMPGNVGHGRNDLTLGPDGKLYLILGNDVDYPADVAPTSPLRHFGQDRLLPCAWNKYLFNSGTPAPGGYVVRTDLEAKSWEVVAGGFRNAYGIAFNDDGEMFTYDADMEWDAGAPWYRPTRINHIVSGGDYGWRQGTDKWRAWYPDSLPSTLDIGLGSPTAVKFVPERFSQDYAGCMLALDWAFGRIIVVRLAPQGASYTARQEAFISGRPLNVCDAEFGPDGALYFVTGGRRTQSGIYRVVCRKPPDVAVHAEIVSLGPSIRRSLEQFHGRQDAKAVQAAWMYLADADAWLRHAARVAVEAQPVEQWQDRALSESTPGPAAYALVALARMAPSKVHPQIIARLDQLPLQDLKADQRIALLRAYQLSFIRATPVVSDLATTRVRLEKLYPAKSIEANDLLCELLVYLESPVVVERTLPLLDAAATPEEKLHYLMCLRLVKGPWTVEQRKQYFSWLQRAEGFPAAHYMPRFIGFIRQDAMATLSEEEKQALGKLIEPAAVAATLSTPPRPFVKAWTLEDFVAEVDQPRAKLDIERAKQLFVAADCAKCHRLAGEGALVGPDLTGVGKRFGKKDLLLSLLEPSRVIDDKYKQKTVTTSQGVSYTGQQVAEDGDGLSIVTDPTQPTKITRIARDEIEESQPSPLSPMPAGLINTLTKEEVLVLIDYLAQ